MLNLRHVNDPGDANERIVHWAKIFKAKTLKELEELAGDKEVYKKMVLELRKLSEDEKIKQQMAARADYESRIATAEGAGYRRGVSEGRREGRQEGRQEGILFATMDFVRDGMCSVEDGAIRTGMSVAEFEKVLSETDRNY